jgi:membrane associated rhomboid family serine protease
MSVTLIIIIITGFTTYKALKDPGFKAKMMFYPFAINNSKEYYRFLTHGLIHADTMHAVFNLYVLYSFGEQVEQSFINQFGLLGIFFYVILYVGALIASSLISYAKHKGDPGYMALGASGAVSAIMFSFILMYPQHELGFIFLPGVPIKGYIIGGLYLVYSHYMAKKNLDNIGHDAHFYGAIFGIFMTLIFRPDFLTEFIQSFS